MARRTAALGLCLVCTTLALAVGVAASAGAATLVIYCGKVVSSGAWCHGGNGNGTVTAPRHSYNWNAANYTGSYPGITVCEEAIPAGADPGTPYQYSYRCAGSYIGVVVQSYYDLNFNCGPSTALLDVYVRQISGSNHSVWGDARYGSGEYPC